MYPKRETVYHESRELLKEHPNRHSPPVRETAVDPFSETIKVLMDKTDVGLHLDDLRGKSHLAGVDGLHKRVKVDRGSGSRPQAICLCLHITSRKGGKPQYSQDPQ